MAAGQLWLFDPPKPLVERLGEDFFRSLPERPGVYLMCGVAEGVLYVGRARNLRQRLSSYRVATRSACRGGSSGCSIRSGGSNGMNAARKPPRAIAKSC